MAGYINGGITNDLISNEYNEYDSLILLGIHTNIGLGITNQKRLTIYQRDYISKWGWSGK